MRFRLCVAFIVAATFAVTVPAGAQQWQPIGPEGGSVRSLSLDPSNPDHIFLGTSAGRIYLSVDGGASWTRYAHLGGFAEMVVDHILIDPSDSQRMYVATWNAQAPDRDGELFRSRDGGKTWEAVSQLHGKSIRALALAPSDSKIIVAGALDGVFRSADAGETWQRVSPENHPELKNVESIAIDPVNPEVIYAGTWHLPWKTEDGGKSWHSIKKGVIDDSDVFSIVIDSQTPAKVYISACSGIYRSDSGGELFRKIQGIPYSARRTRSLRIDPVNHNIVYAGTTEGLWKTEDGRLTWRRMTAGNLIVNDVLIDPRRPTRLLLATDRGGVLASNDGGVSFAASNRGFSHRQVAALLVDRADQSVIYAGMLNDKEFGGVFVSRDRGQTWNQISDGLEGRDVLALRQSYDRSLIAGTDHGIFQLRSNSTRWLALSHAPTELGARVASLEVTPQRWFAGASSGVMVTADSGNTWQKLELQGIDAAVNVAALDRMVVVASHKAIAVSVNGGESWLPTKPFLKDFTINSAAVEPSGDIWIAAHEGVFRSTDMGDSWKRMNFLPINDAASIQFDPIQQRILAMGAFSATVYESRDGGRTWSPINSGWLLRAVATAQGRLLGATPFDGIVLQPETSASIR